MQRLTARLLLLFAIAGTFAPLALAISAAPPHACCIRKTHQCHGSAPSPSDQLAIRSSGCCNRQGSHAVTTSQWANPEVLTSASFERSVTGSAVELQIAAPLADSHPSQSTRAPPVSSLA